MEAVEDRRNRAGSNGSTVKKKRSFGTLFVEFLINGGIVVLVVLIAALALAVNLLLVRWKFV